MRLAPLLLASALAAAPTVPRKAEPAKPLSPAQKADYAKVIQPLFDAHCVSCHGPKKEKGRLRLDTLEATLKGGKNPTFEVGNAVKTVSKKGAFPLDAFKKVVGEVPGIELEYVEVRRQKDLKPCEGKLDQPAVMLTAARACRNTGGPHRRTSFPS